MTQQLLADRIGRSKSWIEKVEAGKRSADRLPVLTDICRELRVDMPVLIGQDLQRDTHDCLDDIQVEFIRAVLERYDASQDEASGSQPDVERLRRQVSHIWSAFELADYAVISQTLPSLLIDAQRAYSNQSSDDVTILLTETYQIAASTLRKLGEYNLAWLSR